MADPSSALYVPHLMGINLDSDGIAQTLVTAVNRTTGDRQTKKTDGNKLVVFDAADFTSGYSVNDVIEFTNAGSSAGQNTITISDATGGFQSAEIDCVAAATVAINL